MIKGIIWSDFKHAKNVFNNFKIIPKHALTD